MFRCFGQPNFKFSLSGKFTRESALISKLTDKKELEASYESMGLDTKLIEDNSYFLIFMEDNLIGSGGYSIRKTLFGGNHTPNRSNEFLIPGKEPSKIRANFLCRYTFCLQI